MDPIQRDSQCEPDAAPSSSSAGSFPPFPGTLDRALGVVAYLRMHCDWDRRQTARSLVPHLLEEARETAEAIQSGDSAQTRDELGDLLLNVAFQIVVAEEAARFSREDVIRGLENKMVRRHPHLFGLGDPEDWETLKARERSVSSNPDDDAPSVATADGAERGGSVLDALPPDSDPLERAQLMQLRASEVGFDWPHASGALEKTREEVQEVAEAVESGSHAAMHEELGDLLFSVVNLARLAGCHAPSALAAANEKFDTRFRAVESLAAARGLLMPGASLEDLDALWEEVKLGERSHDGTEVPRTP